MIRDRKPVPWLRRPERREAQRRLAAEVTRMTHGESGLQKALAATDVLFGGDISGLSADELLDIFRTSPPHPFLARGWRETA